jgi:CBS domain-containing protein
VAAGTDIRGVARLMLDAHIHRVGVVDEAHRLVGIITSTDLLAAVAYAGAGG